MLARFSSDRPAAKAWRRKSSVRSDIVVITESVVQGADDVVIGDPDQPNRVRPTQKSCALHEFTDGEQEKNLAGS